MEFSFQATQPVDDTALRAYQEKHEAELQQRQQNAESQRQEILEQARDELQALNEKRVSEIEKRRSKNKSDEQKFTSERDRVLESKSSSVWEGVGSLIDFKAISVGRDTTRFRKLLIDLKGSA